MKQLTTQPTTALNSILTYGLIAIIFLSLGISSLFNPFGTDQGEYATIASAAQAGKVIYRDIFNVKPPLTHLLHQAALTLFGHSMLSLRIVDLLWQGLTVGFIIAIANALFRGRAAGLLAATIYILWYFSIDYWNTAQTDGFINLPVTVGIFCYIQYLNTRRLGLLWLGGCAFGLAVFFKYPIGIIVPLLVGALFFNPAIPRLRAIAMLAGGFSAVVAGFTVYLLIQGSLRDFLHIQLTYIPLYNKIESASYGYGTAFIRRFVLFWQTDTLVTSPITPLVAYMIMRWKKTLRAYGVVLIWWLAATIHLGVQQKFYYYHGIPLLAPAALLLAYCLREIATAARRSPLLWRAAQIGGVLALAWLYVALGHLNRHRFLGTIMQAQPAWERIYASFPPYNNYSVKETQEVAAYVKERTNPADTIFIWGTEPTIYFLSQRSPASRFIYNFILYERFQQPGYRQELIDDLRDRQPVYIIVPENDALPEFTGELDSATALLQFAELKQVLDTEYVVEAKVYKYSLYRRK